MTATTHRPVSRPPRDPAAEPWSGPWRRFDLVKEFVIATVVVALLTVLLAAVFSSPDEKPITLQAWAKADPNDFVATAVAELNEQSGTATYGAPYNNAPDSGQKLGPLPLQRWGGVRVPVDTADDFVLGPLRAVPNDPALTAALTTYSAAPADQQSKWASAYGDALSTAPDGDPAKVAKGDYGPVPTLTGRLLNLTASGGLDGALTSERGQFYASDYTKPLMFLADGSYLEDQARGQHLAGDQWGMMNETGNYPGQAWLWLYTFWYQIKPFSTSDNADALVWGLMALLTLLLLLLPFVPGLRSIPRLIPLHRIIWRDYYRRQNRT